MDTKISAISVRNLVEFIMRSGSIDNRVGEMPDMEAMLAGSRIHRKIQSAQREGYRAEVVLKDDIDFDDVTIHIEGRADGIFQKDGLTIIDEIKGVARDIDKMEAPEAVHLAQARVYGAIYLKQNEGDSIGVQMTYVNLETEDVRRFHYSYSRADNEIWYRNLVEEWHKWISFRQSHISAFRKSLETLTFPFDYRPGQKKLVASVYHTIAENKQLFIEAPTGVGKTISVIYPTIRAMGEGKAERFFYLTAKAVTRAVPVETLEILRQSGLQVKYAVMMAKEKLCPRHDMTCNPDDCPYADGHFDRINAAVFKLLTEEDVYDAAHFLKAAEENQVCPFELALDTAVWADGIICDYNYAFDPNVRLKRFFGDGVKSEAVILIDEAHNLVDRSREMYSGFLNKDHVLAAKRVFKDKAPRIVKSLEKINRILLSEKKILEITPADHRVVETLMGLDTASLRVLGDMQAYFENDGAGEDFTEVSDFFFELRDFLSACDRMDERFVLYEEVNGDGEFIFHVRCVDPSQDLQMVMDKAVSTILFSATLLPIDYYRKLLSGRTDDYAVYAETPFTSNQRRLLIGRKTGTRYKDRGASMYRRIAGAIHDTVKAHRGNYMAFFPSYKVMEDVFEVYRREFDEPDVNWVVQSRVMFEEAREIFLEDFYEDPNQSLIGFCVMGGIFSEGIDLTGSRLVGAIVVGTGLPQISGEREVLRAYYDSHNQDGFGYAYRIPGMNKVQQAAGRVIRSVEDRGVIVLLDQRFLGRDYQRLFPREWLDAYACDEEEIGSILKEFWERPC